MGRKVSSDRRESISRLSKVLRKFNIDCEPPSIFDLKVSIVGTPFDCMVEMAYLGKFPLLPRPFTIGGHRCSISVNNKSLDVIITVQAGELKLPLSLEEKYSLFDNSDYIIITFDKGNRQSSTEVKKYLQICGEYKTQEFLLVLLGFITGQEEVTTQEGKELAKELACSYFETRPSDKEQIYNIYRFIGRKHLTKLEKETFSP